jgi:hypothetical protein
VKAPGLRSEAFLRAILIFGAASTLLHNSHNAVEVDRYPGVSWISDEAIQVAAAVGWPVYTAVALYGYRLYRRRRFPHAHVALTAYAAYCLFSLGHLVVGLPDLAPFWLATIFTDGLAGLLVLGFVAWSVRASRGARPARLRGPHPSA